MSEEKLKCANCGREEVPTFELDYFDVNGQQMCEPCAMPFLLGQKEPTEVANDHMNKVCRSGSGCMYLVANPKFSCAKYTSLAHLLRENVKNGKMRSTGDNCSGPPSFKILEPSTVQQ